MSNDVVIIGGGVAAINAIKAIREVNAELKIHVIQDEAVHPYFRTRLTKSLFENLDADKILLQKKEWYEQNQITLHLDKRAVAINTDQCMITLNDGSSLEYGKLLLANGAMNFKPPVEGIDLENVFTIRKFEDIQTIKECVDDKKTVLHLGGGIQNLEAAWAMYTNGKKVVIAEFMDRLMPRQLDAKGSELLKRAVLSCDIKVTLNTQIVKLTGDKKVTGAVAKSGETIDCDMVIYSVGIRSNKHLTEHTAIQTNNGVLVNDHMQTNIANVYAAGDVAELAGSIGGLWPVAINQGKIAGYNIAGKDAVYGGTVPVTMMNAFQLSVFSVGTIDENSYSSTIIDESSDDSSYQRLFIKDNVIIGAIIIGGDTRSNQLLKKYVEDQLDISYIDQTNITVKDLLAQLKN